MELFTAARYRGKDIEIYEILNGLFDIKVDGKVTQYKLTAKEVVSWCMNAMQNTPEKV